MKAKKLSTLIVITALTTGLFGCNTSPTKYVDKDQPTELVSKGLSSKDFEFAAHKSIEDLLKSGAMNKPSGGRYVLAISDIINDTMQRIDTDQLVKKIRVAVLQSGKAVVSTAVSANGPEDKMSMDTRQLRGNDEFNQRTVAKKGQIIAPELSLSGKIVQKNVKIDKSTEQIDYYFQLSLTDITTGLAIWETEQIISKIADSSAVSW